MHVAAHDWRVPRPLRHRDAGNIVAATNSLSRSKLNSP